MRTTITITVLLLAALAASSADSQPESGTATTSAPTEKCPYCHGLGQVPCQKCLGANGQPTGVATCEKCGGSGKIKCPDCHGKWGHKCERCKGTGRATIKVSDRSAPTKIMCPDCHGTGDVYTCKGQCAKTRSKGIVTCPDCGGTRRHGVCPACDGTKKMPCPVCQKQASTTATKPAGTR